MTNNRQNPWLATRTRTGAEYDAPYQERAANGEDIHGEANLVEALLQTHFPERAASSLSVLDGGCGTGRMGIELTRRGYDVVGADLDEVMLSQAQRKAPEMTWLLADLSTVSIDKRFDAIVLAGNVMIYVTPGTERAVLANMVGHLKPGGLLLAAFELNPYPWTELTIDRYDGMLAELGMEKVERWSTWDRDEWGEWDKYAVSLHGLASRDARATG